MISSFKLGKRLRIELCEHRDCKGNWDDVMSYVGPYKSEWIGRWDNVISVVKTYNYDETDLNQARVQIFANCNY